MASRIARLVVDEVLEGSDLGIDLHTAANHRTNHPQVRLDTSDPVALDAAVAFGAPFVLDAKLRSGSLRAAASERGVPVLTYEGGGPSRFDPDAIEVAERGILRVLHRLGAIDGAPRPPHPTRWCCTSPAGCGRSAAASSSCTSPRVTTSRPASRSGPPRAARRGAGGAGARRPAYVIGATTLPLVQPGQAIVHLALPGDRVPSEDDPSDEEDALDEDEGVVTAS
jgi:uncharacterized protein